MSEFFRDFSMNACSYREQCRDVRDELDAQTMLVECLRDDLREDKQHIEKLRAVLRIRTGFLNEATDELRKAKQRIQELELLNAWRNDWTIMDKVGWWEVVHKPTVSMCACVEVHQPERGDPRQMLAMLCRSIGEVTDND